jgi:hypothetical protein
MTAPASFIPESMDVYAYAGDPVTVQLTVSDEGEPLALTGTVEAQIRKRRADPDPPVAEFNVAVDVAAGVVLLGLTAATTTALGAANGGFLGEWDCQWFPPAAEPLTLIQGRISCKKDVTRL